MRLLTTLLVTLLLGLGLVAAQAAHTRVQLLLDHERARPGDTVLAGVQLRMDPDWHTYWRNAGDAGIPTEIRWHVPGGVTTNAIEWPVPIKLVEQELTTYIYTGEVVLLVPLKLAANLPAGPLQLQAEVSWLECKIQCVPGKAQVEATLEVGNETRFSGDAAVVTNWQTRLPKRHPELRVQSRWESAATGESRPWLIEWTPSAAVTGQPDFLPYGSSRYEVQAPTEVLASTADRVRLRKQVRKLEGGEWPQTIPGDIIQGTEPQNVAYEVDVPVGNTVPTAAGATGSSVWLMLVYGFLGGLILNVMPCVLPVIALKILSFVGQAKEEPARVRKLGLVYTAGILVSFLVLAVLGIGLKLAGRQVGWGMQFSNPQFVVVMTILMTLVALNLFGLFEVTPGGRVLGAAGSLTAKKGVAGAFFNGVLATVLATSCTAAFLSYALGFASSGNPLMILLIMLAVGLGMALPYLVLSWHPAWLKFLPKPGPWMEKFKVAMGFPVLATAVWLLSLMPDYYGSRGWWLGVFLVIVALVAWIYGEFVQRGKAHRGLGLALALGLMIAGYWAVLERQLQWRSAVVIAQAAPRDTPQGIAWRLWSPAEIAAARAEGRPVLVDFTANWCWTCNAIVKPALENDSVREKIAHTGTIALLADYTHSPPEMTTELNRFGRAGVPLVVVYPKNGEAPAVVLPDPAPLSLPFHYSKVIVDALTRAAE